MDSENQLKGVLPHYYCFSMEEEKTNDFLYENHYKVVHFIRHGQAAHQIKAAEEAKKGHFCDCFKMDPTKGEHDNDCPYLDPALIDSPLTEKGKEHVAGKVIETETEVVLSAATTRALETAISATELKSPKTELNTKVP